MIYDIWEKNINVSKGLFSRFNIEASTTKFNVYMPLKFFLFDLKANELAYFSKDPESFCFDITYLYGLKFPCVPGIFTTMQIILFKIQASHLNWIE